MDGWFHLNFAPIVAEPAVGAASHVFQSTHWGVQKKFCTKISINNIAVNQKMIIFECKIQVSSIPNSINPSIQNSNALPIQFHLRVYAIF